jgi:hypothetical protein
MPKSVYKDELTFLIIDQYSPSAAQRADVCAATREKEASMAQAPQEQDGMKEFAQVMSRAWSDEAYKQRLLTDPKAVLAEAGLPVPPNVNLQVHESTPTQVHIVLPPPPPGQAGAKLSDEELDQVAGGWFSCSVSCVITWIRSFVNAATGG